MRDFLWRLFHRHAWEIVRVSFDGRSVTEATQRCRVCGRTEHYGPRSFILGPQVLHRGGRPAGSDAQGERR